jgi:hypothetical protein
MIAGDSSCPVENTVAAIGTDISAFAALAGGDDDFRDRLGGYQARSRQAAAADTHRDCSDAAVR